MREGARDREVEAVSDPREADFLCLLLLDLATEVEEEAETRREEEEVAVGAGDGRLTAMLGTVRVGIGLP